MEVLPFLLKAKHFCLGFQEVLHCAIIRKFMKTTTDYWRVLVLVSFNLLIKKKTVCVCVCLRVCARGHACKHAQIFKYKNRENIQ